MAPQRDPLIDPIWLSFTLSSDTYESTSKTHVLTIAGSCLNHIEHLVQLLPGVDWMFVPTPQILMLKPSVQWIVLGSGGLGRWMGHEGGALMNGVSASYKRPLEHPFTFLHMRTQGDYVYLLTKNGPSLADTRFSGTLIMYWPVSRAVKVNVWCLWEPRIWYFVMTAWVICMWHKMGAAQPLVSTMTGPLFVPTD